MRIPSVLGAPLSEGQLHTVSAAVATAFHRQHNVDDTHATIIATGTITEKSRSKAMGYWLNFAPLGADKFAGSAAAWTVSVANQVLLEYMLIGETCFLHFDIGSTSVTAGSTYLAVTLPTAILPVSGNQVNGCEVIDNGTFVAGFCQSAVNTTTAQGELRIFRHDAANFAASASNTTVRGTAIFKIANP